MTGEESSDSTTGSGAAVVSAFFAAAFFAGAFLAAAFFAGAFFAAAFFAGAFFAAGFVSSAGSSGCTSRMRPSRSARRRTMSAYASSRAEAWVLIGTPSVLQRSTVSALVMPSSFASSCTRIFFAT
jgi:hypothetical protein